MALEPTEDSDKIKLGVPQSTDASAVNLLIQNSPPLDTNSLYCNLLQTSHFANTAIVAKLNDQVVGFVSGYIKPEQPDTYFLWQVVVGEQARGRGLAKHMITALFERDNFRDVHWLETTITPDNTASQRLFKSLASDWQASIDVQVFFDKHAHFAGQHESEELYRIGPLQR
ncbi:diaminobutyrate acetyltransferase [Aliidiomarina halalkaliphila]|uniref:L-2,4-diaminobutyric acid acetyltransferase n=1 Tax=Aliidiomarina halalkaliphila TaxID=2593535 RepID=A0A552X1J8_9GAMM|nr:diaminobutyrate acetyltransferase [Aliidiomarina halalkaliphila]TRW48894.1 diaminobutyrate acetyltransferase [Aliidiomarina halalkaliphila]